MQEQSETLRRALEALAAICGPSPRKTVQTKATPKAEPTEPRPQALAVHDPAAWAEDFHRWALSRCVFRDRCFGGISALWRDFAEWQVMRDDVPPTRRTFEALLRDAGFLFADGLVYGLLLKARLDHTVPIGVPN
jgi:hypothetical protein